MAESIEDELRELTDALREHLLWQKACGASGIPAGVALASDAGIESLDPPAPRAQRPAPPQPQFDPPPAVQYDAPAAATVIEPRRPQFAIPADSAGRIARLQVLSEEARVCTKCSLHLKRTQAVFSRGTPTTELMFIGEGPGADEDAQGEPFVGKAGQLLDRMILAMGLNRDQVYICNIVKCRPPDNRTPEPEEIAACAPFVHEQIALVGPKAIVALGATAVKGLLGVSEGITRLRGKWRLYRAAIPVMPTFHPAYLLRKEDAKRDVWNDLKAVMVQLGRPVQERKH